MCISWRVPQCCGAMQVMSSIHLCRQERWDRSPFSCPTVLLENCPSTQNNCLFLDCKTVQNSAWISNPQSKPWVILLRVDRCLMALWYCPIPTFALQGACWCSQLKRWMETGCWNPLWLQPLLISNLFTLRTAQWKTSVSSPLNNLRIFRWSTQEETAVCSPFLFTKGTYAQYGRKHFRYVEYLSSCSSDFSLCTSFLIPLCSTLFWQIAAQWSDVSLVQVDDFLECGSDQMLLVFKDQGETGQPLERFLLTDLCGISYAVRHNFHSHMLCYLHAYIKLQFDITYHKSLERQRKGYEFKLNKS